MTKRRGSNRSIISRMTRFEPGTCNTIDDRTGFKEKLSDTAREWDGYQIRHDLLEPRHPQDFPIRPKTPKVYPDARFQDEENITVYTAPEDVTKL